MKTDVSRKILYMFGLVGYLSWTAAPPVHAAETASTYDWCSESCGATASCSTECENDGGGTITCGEYHDGPANSWCLEECSEVCTAETACNRDCLQTGDPFDCETYAIGICDNTCETVCSSASSTGEEFCLGNGGVGTTCANYGKFRQCNDGVCAPGEVCVCSECSLYCNDHDATLLAPHLPENPTYNESDIFATCEAANLYWGVGWTCPDWELLNSDDSCASTAMSRAIYELIGQQADAVAAAMNEEYNCEANPSSEECQLAASIKAIADQAWDDYYFINGFPCYL